MQKVSDVESELSELATLLNQFKSEAVQLRILEWLLGEQTLAANEADAVPSSSSSRSTRKKRPAGKSKEARPPEVGKKTAGGKGANATLSSLAKGNFFSTYRPIGDIIEHARVNLARHFKANEFSGKLARMVRSGE